MLKKLRSDLILFSIALIWGSSYPVISRMLVHITPYALLFLRCAAAVPILLVVFGKRILHAEKGLIKSGIIIGLLMGIGMVMILYGLSITSSLNTALIVGITCPLTALLSSIILKKKPDTLTIIGIVVCFAGAYFLGGGVSYKLNIGDIIIFTSDFVFVFHTILIDKYNEKYDPSLLGSVQIIASCILSFIIWIIYGASPIIINKTILYGFVHTGLFGLGFAFTFQAIAQKHTTPTHTSLIFGSEPVFGILFSLFIPNAKGIYETLNISKAVGCILVILGIILAEANTILTSKGTNLSASPPNTNTSWRKN